jgi:transformation/transcription domain-associated protein
MKVCEAHKAEPPVWYWISFIPELISSLAGKEAKFAKSILIRIAKAYPQALHFHLRTAKEDFANMKRQLQNQNSYQSNPNTPAESNNNDVVRQEESSHLGDTEDSKQSSGNEASNNANTEGANAQITNNAPWENVEEIMSILKTAFPLLALTMESMVDQILQRLKPSTDEDIYRLIVALLNDGVHMYISHLPKHPENGGSLSQATENSLARFAESMNPNHLKYKDAFEEDFINSKPI